MNYLEIVKIRLKIRWGQVSTKEMQHFLETARLFGIETQQYGEEPKLLLSG